jgi:hypothetical protein
MDIDDYVDEMERDILDENDASAAFADDEAVPIMDLTSPELTFTVSGYAKDVAVLSLLTAILRKELAQSYYWAQDLLMSGFPSLFPLFRHLYYDFYYEYPGLEAYLDRKEKSFLNCTDAEKQLITLTVIKNLTRLTGNARVFLWRQLTYSETVMLDYDINRLSLSLHDVTSTLILHIKNNDWFNMCYELRWLFDRDLGTEALTAVYDYYAKSPLRKSISTKVMEQHHTFIQILLVIARCETSLLNTDKIARYLTLDAKDQVILNAAKTTTNYEVPPYLHAFHLLDDGAYADVDADNEHVLSDWLRYVFPDETITYLDNLEEDFKFRF